MTDILSLTVYTDLVANSACTLFADSVRAGVTVADNAISIRTAVRGDATRS